MLIRTIEEFLSRFNWLNFSAITLEEIDLKNQLVTVRSKRVRAILKLSLMEAVADSSIIANLHPVQACWLGYYAGLIYQQDDLHFQNQNLQSSSNGFGLKFKSGQYRIVSKGRKGEISYSTNIKSVLITDHPINIAQDRSTISSFDASQACYIGILAGIYAAKHGDNSKQSQKKQPLLRLIK